MQKLYNKKYGYVPKSIEKPVGDSGLPGMRTDTGGIGRAVPKDYYDAIEICEVLNEKMKEAAENLEFELAADIRDRIRELQKKFKNENQGISPEE